MTIPENIFKSYDIRGIYPTEINEENVSQITKAIFAFLTKDYPAGQPFKFGLGRDMRLSSPALFQIAKDTLISLGAQVVDLGLLSTPSFYFAVSNLGLDGGFIISASHNPKEYNGMKIIRKIDKGVLKIGKNTGIDEIKRLALEGVQPPAGQGSVTEESSVLEKEAEKALEIAGHPNIKPFKVVADAGNAMGSLYVEELFKHIPGELTRMNFNLDGNFPAHQPDPLQPKNLVDLQNKVRETGADIGLAPDGDGDRMFIVDENGQIVPPSIITSIIAKELLKTHPGATIIADIRYLINARENVDEAGGKLSVSKVGHAFITEQLQNEGAIFAGESSAHYFFAATGGAEAQMPVILIILAVMSREGKPLSEIAESCRRAFESSEINFEVKNGPELLDLVKQKYADGEISTLDGVAVSYPDLRISLRSSNTEPLIRLNVEAKDKVKMEQTKNEVVQLIQSAKK